MLLGISCNRLKDGELPSCDDNAIPMAIERWSVGLNDLANATAFQVAPQQL